MTTTLQKTIYLKADKSTVWAFLTEPDRLSQWFHRPQTSLQQGADYAMFGTTSGEKLMWGTVTVARPYDYLEYTFTITPMGDTISTVAWTLDDVPGGTRLSLVHDGLPQTQEAFGLILALDKGWDDHFARLRVGASSP